MSKFTLPMSQFKLLIHLAENDIVSLTEVHQLISPIIKKLLLNKHFDFYDEQNIVNVLLDLTCIKREFDKQLTKEIHGIINTVDVTENDIHNDFKNQIRRINAHSNCFLRRNIFLENLQFISNHFRSESRLSFLTKFFYQH
jgi:hypothetical protein